MSVNCSKCGSNINENLNYCPKCGNQLLSDHLITTQSFKHYRGFEWKSETVILGFPLIHVAVGRDKNTGKLLVAKGIIAIGQFGIGIITIAQFGIGLLFGFGQFLVGLYIIAQFAGGVYFGLGQFATGITAIGQFAFGKYVLAQLGYGEYIWSTKIKNPEALEYFQKIWMSVKSFLGM